MFVLQLVFYLGLFLLHAYLGILVTVLMSVITLVILIVSYLVEKIEPSGVPRSYFQWMWLIFLAPFLVLLFSAGLRLVS